MGLYLVTPPAAEPVATSDLKEFMYIVDSAQDQAASDFGITARQTLEGTRYPGLGIAFLEQTWRLTLDSFPNGKDGIVVPRPPLISITSLKYTDSNANVATLTENVDYVVDPSGPFGTGTGQATIWPSIKGWPLVALAVSEAVEVIYDCGWETPADVPAPLILAIKMLAAETFESRGTGAIDLCGLDLQVAAWRSPGYA